MQLQSCIKNGEIHYALQHGGVTLYKCMDVNEQTDDQVFTVSDKEIEEERGHAE